MPITMRLTELVPLLPVAGVDGVDDVAAASRAGVAGVDDMFCTAVKGATRTRGSALPRRGRFNTDAQNTLGRSPTDCTGRRARFRSPKLSSNPCDFARRRSGSKCRFTCTRALVLCLILRDRWYFLQVHFLISRIGSASYSSRTGRVDEMNARCVTQQY